MHKKLIMAFVVLAVFAIPPAASASPVLTNSTGVKVPVGEEIKWTNTGDYLGTGAAGLTWKCTTADFQFKVTENSGTSVKGEAAAGSTGLTGTGAGGDCTTSGFGDIAWTFNSKLCFSTVPKTDQIQVTGCGGNIVYTEKRTEIAPCKYSLPSMTGTFITGPPGATASFPEVQSFLVESSTLFCPSQDRMDLHFDLTTSTGETLLIS